MTIFVPLSQSTHWLFQQIWLSVGVGQLVVDPVGFRPFVAVGQLAVGQLGVGRLKIGPLGLGQLVVGPPDFGRLRVPQFYNISIWRQ